MYDYLWHHWVSSLVIVSTKSNNLVLKKVGIARNVVVRVTRRSELNRNVNQKIEIKKLVEI